VHRDIKPKNILLADGHALITDFGVARAVSAAGSTGMTTLGMAVGTPAYMSPEQAAADPNLDHRADIYALGLVAYEMLSGRTTFAGGTPQQVLAAQITRDPEPIEQLRPETPEPLAALVMQCLRKEPAQRPQTMDALMPVLSQASSPGLESAGERRRHRRWLRIAAVVVVLAALVSAGAVIAGRLGAPSGEAPAAPAVPVRSLAVLPFATLHGDSSDTYFGEGIAEEILHAVSRIPGLHVAGRTSSFRYAGGDADLRQIGRDLGVSRVLEGTVQRIGQRIRVTAQLVDAVTGYGLWSERYDRQLEDIFAVQDEIARAVAGALEVQLAGNGPDASRTRDPQAHDAYLLGLSHLHARDVGAAIAQFERAIAADSSYADAHAALSSALALAPEYTAIPSDSAAPAAEAAARRALALDSTDSRALAALGYVSKNYRWRYDDAERAYRAAIALDPNDATVRHWYGELLDLRGQFDSARAQYRQALTLDPVSSTAHVSIGGHFLVLHAGQPGRDSAVAHIARAAELNPRNLQYPYFLAMIAIRSGDLPEAREQFRRAGAAIGDASLLLPLVDALENPSDVDRAMGMLRAWEAGGPLPDVLIARWYVDLGAPREALRILERGVERRAPYMTYLDYFGLDGLYGETGYRELRRRIGLRIGR
jgi:serine/threonine-protein kinase